MVSQSLFSGLFWLIGIFIAIGWWISRSWRIALGVGVALCFIPMGMLGLFGYFRIPMDVIATPAANIAIGMGVDAMLHTICFLRQSCGRKAYAWESWAEACTRKWMPIASSAFILCIGFGIFGLSAFPPTQRFGISILVGSLISPLATLFILPAVSTAFRNR